MFCTLPKDQQSLSERGKIVNILGFVGQRRITGYYVGKYVTRERTNFHKYFTGKIKNIMIIIEYNDFLYHQSTLRINSILFPLNSILFNWDSKLIISIIKIDH